MCKARWEANYYRCTSPPTCCCLDVLHVCCGDLWIVCKAFQAGVSSQHDRRRDQSAERLIYALASLAESATSGGEHRRRHRMCPHRHALRQFPSTFPMGGTQTRAGAALWYGEVAVKTPGRPTDQAPSNCFA